MRKIETQQLPI